MARKALILEVSSDLRHAIFIDEGNKEDIERFLKRPKNLKKFKYIKNLIFEDVENTNVYSREIVNDIRNVWAMKAFKGGNNPRIYCQQIMLDGTICCVICCEYLPKKKTEGVTGKTLRVVERVSKFEYDPKQLKQAYENEKQEILKRADQEDK